MQCKDARGDCPCTEPDPNRQHVLVPVLVVNRGMKDFASSYHSKSHSLERSWALGKQSPTWDCFYPSHLVFTFWSTVLGVRRLGTDPTLPQKGCMPWTLLSRFAPWLALKFWCHISSLNAGSWISSGIWRREMGKFPFFPCHLSPFIQSAHGCAKLCQMLGPVVIDRRG